MNNKERINYMDNLKGILIFLVVFGHVISTKDYPSNTLTYIYNFIYFFHMPAFIFIMGFFSKNYEKCSRNSIVDYFIPYVVLVALSFLQIKFTVADEETLTVFRLFSPASSCWFLLAACIWKMITKDLVRIRFIIPFSLLVGLGIGFSHEFGYKMSLSRIGVFTFFYIWGVLTTQDQLEKIRKYKKTIMFLLLIISASIIYYLTFSTNMSTETVLCRTYYRDEFVIQDFIYRIVFYIIATIMIFVLLNFAPNRESKLTLIGKRTLTIYYFHMFFVRFIDKYFYDIKFLKQNKISYLIVTALVSIIITLILSTEVVQKFYNFIFSNIKKIFFFRQSMEEK